VDVAPEALYWVLQVQCRAASGKEKGVNRLNQQLGCE